MSSLPLNSSTPSLLPLSMDSLQSMHHFSQFYNEFITFNATSHFTCWKGRNFVQYLAHCHVLHETNVYVATLLLSFIVCHVMEWVVRQVSYRTKTWQSLEFVESVRWHNKYVCLFL